MGQQIRKVTKRRRRIEYLKRKKEQSKLNSMRLSVWPFPLPRMPSLPPRKLPPKDCGQGPGQKTETKAAAAKKAPAKKPAAKKAAEPAAE